MARCGIRYAWATMRASYRLPLHSLLCTTALVVLVGCSSSPPAKPARAPATSLSHEQAHDIAIHALGLVGTPYRYGGNTPDTGFDCSGLIGYVYRNRVGTAPPRTVAQLSQWGQPVASQALRTGDLVVFGTGRTPTHAGIYVGEGRFVHAPSSGGTVRLDHLQSPHWSRQNAAFLRP